MVRHLGLLAVMVGLVCAAFVAGSSSPPRTLVSTDRPELKIGQRTGYFNMPRVMKEYRRANEAVVHLTARRERAAANIIGIKAMFLELQARAQRADDPKVRDHIAHQALLLTRQVEDLERTTNKILNERASTLITDLYHEIHVTIAEMAKKHGLVAVLAHPVDERVIEQNAHAQELFLKPQAAQPFFIDPTVDYTNELIRRLNEKYADEQE